MAIWQYELSLISKLDIDSRDGAFNYEAFDNLKGWCKDQFYGEAIGTLSYYMKKAESWSEEVEIWGEEEKTCFRIYFNSDYITEINVRIDVRTVQDKSIINIIIKLCEILDAKIVNSGFNFISPNPTDIIKDLKASSSYKFVSNPKKFLDGLK